MVFIAIVCGIVYTSVVFDSLRYADFFDLKAFYTAAEVLKEGNNPYDYSVLERKSQEVGIPQPMPDYSYPPFYAIMLRPFTNIGFHNTGIICILLDQFVLAGIVIGYIWCVGNGRNTWFILTISIIMFSLSEPLAQTLRLGQVTLIVLGFVAGGLYFMKKRHDMLAGILLGIATIIKLQPVLLLLYLLYKRMYMVFFSAIVTFTLLMLVSMSIVGVQIHYDWIKSGDMRMYSEGLVAPYNLTLQSYIGYHLKSDFSIYITRVIQITLAFLIMVLCRRDITARGTSLNLEYSFVMVSMMMFSPVYWNQHYVYFILPFIVIFDHLTTRKVKIIPVFTVSLAFALISLKYDYFSSILQDDSGVILDWLTFYGGVMLWIIYAYTLSKLKDDA